MVNIHHDGLWPSPGGMCGSLICCLVGAVLITSSLSAHADDGVP